jgi:diamine N-acetyltransferase
MSDDLPRAVREATEADLDTIAALGVEVQQLHHDARPDLFVPADRDALRGFFAGRLADDRFVVLLAGDDGYLLAEHQVREATPFTRGASTLYVHHIGVRSAARSAGVGTALLAAAETRGRELGAVEIVLDSLAFNAGAHAFFAARGFVPRRFTFEKPLRPGLP